MGFSWLGRRRQREEMVDTLYAKAVEQARLPVFYAEREVPDTVDGRFDLLVLHVFLLLHRLGAEGRETKRLNQGLTLGSPTFGTQAMQQQEDMQHKQVEAAIHRVGH